MDITSLPSLSDFFDGADQLGEVFALLPVLVLLELILSADNAVALAAIARSSRQPEQERLALNVGIGMAFVLRDRVDRSGSVGFATCMGSDSWLPLYLVWLVVDHFQTRSDQTQKRRPWSADAPERPVNAPSSTPLCCWH